MIKKGNKLYSIFTGVCPKCHQESMYPTNNPYIIKDVINVKDHCSKCGTKYKIEPSFFFGAMYVSYAVGIAFAVAAFVIAYLLFNLSLLTTFVAIVITLIIFLPVIVRWSRNIWINFFFSYDPQKAKN